MNTLRGAAVIAASLLIASNQLIPTYSWSGTSTGDLHIEGQAAVTQPKCQFLEDVRHLIGGLSESEMKILETRDIAVLVDKSTSMKQIDCRDYSGGAINRWQWVQHQVTSLAQCCNQLANRSITLVTFDSEAQTFENVSPQSIKSIFDQAQPQGNTNLARALNLQLQDYFRRKRHAPSQTRPLAIAVITDGLPDSTNLVRLTIREATRRMTDDSEIAIVFLQIGSDPKGGAFLSSLDRKLMNSGAQRDIVSVRSFADLSTHGLGQSMLAAINRGRTL